ncbi:KLHL9 [Branchiostoma lanceolatum]|uniref:KLHL9 protein n=1 Tax=Branchiostoma lanceolatum TaxID=7740 RepID=A0A8J9Z798_BRALA|nr:KLHL9 [Branchiostoma lanceolatum]
MAAESTLPSPLPADRTFSSSRHSSEVLRYLNTLRTDALLCDITLVVDGKEIPAHKNILASCSDYFRAMFTRGMRECNQDTVEIKGVPYSGLENVVQYMYTSQITLNSETVQDVLTTANHLQISAVVQFCHEYLISIVDVDNCVDIGKIAQTFSLLDLRSVVDRFMLRRFSVLADQDDFQRLSIDELSALLESDDLCTCSEIEVFEAVVKWLEYDSSRQKHMSELMSRVRFPLMSPAELVDRVQTVDFMHSDVSCMRILQETFTYHVLPHRQPVMQSPRTQVRSTSSHLVIVGGEPSSRASETLIRSVKFLDTGGSSWREVTAMERPRSHKGVAVLGNFLYVAGGSCTSHLGRLTATNEVHRYDPQQDSWFQTASMLESRTDFHLAAIGNQLFAVAGRNDADKLATVERYNPYNDAWAYVASLEEPVVSHAVCVDRGYLYVSGGYNGSFQNTFQRYNLEADRWENMTAMTTARGWHCMTSSHDRIYVFGGTCENGSGIRGVLQDEYYDPSTQQWAKTSPMLCTKSEAGIAVYEGKIFIIGGYSWDRNEFSKSVECYLPEEDRWEKVADLPEPCTGVGCSVLRLPQCVTSNCNHAHPERAAANSVT